MWRAARAVATKWDEFVTRVVGHRHCPGGDVEVGAVLRGCSACSPSIGFVEYRYGFF